MGPSSQRLELPEVARIDATQFRFCRESKLWLDVPHPGTARGLFERGPTSDGDGGSTPVPKFRGNFERVLRDFCLFFLPHREYVRMRKDLIAKEKEAKLIPGQKVPSTTGTLRFLHQWTNTAAMAASENFPGILPLFPETQAGPLQARQAPLQPV